MEEVSTVEEVESLFFRVIEILKTDGALLIVPVERFLLDDSPLLVRYFFHHLVLFDHFELLGFILIIVLDIVHLELVEKLSLGIFE